MRLALIVEDALAADGHLEELVADANRVEAEAKASLEEAELEQKMPLLWEKSVNLVENFGLRVLTFTGYEVDNFVNIFMTGEATDRNVKAAHFGDTKYLLVNKEEMGDPPHWEDMLNLLHEAAHLITGQYEGFDESEGVCQVELVMAKMVSQEVYEKLVQSHKTDYGWGSTSYSSEKRTKKWKEGTLRAKVVLKKFVESFDKVLVAQLKEALRVIQ